jgi:uncharacterized protein YodC (DUF2158 family)
MNDTKEAPLFAGELVQLKSGGPVMTIDWIEGDQATCSWFDGKEECWSGGKFSVATLCRKKGVA